MRTIKENAIGKAYREEIELNELFKRIPSKYKTLRGSANDNCTIVIVDTEKKFKLESLNDIREMQDWERDSKGVWILDYYVSDREKAIKFVNQFI